MKDIDSVEQFIVNELPRILPIINTDKISIIGHSKGGVSALLYCTHTILKLRKYAPRVRLILSQLESKFIHKWRSQGVQYIKNARTNQMMPMNIEVLEDMEINKESI
jgi:S-formylglutathione hydrolase FrmB